MLGRDCDCVQARAQLAAAALHRQVAERQRDDALGTVAELQAQLECIGDDIQLHMSEAEAERQRSEVAASHKGPPTGGLRVAAAECCSTCVDAMR